MIKTSAGAWNQSENTALLPSLMADLESGYEFKHREEVIDFLQEHHYLVALLDDAYHKIQEYFGEGTEAFLEIASDYDSEGEDFREVFVRIVTRLSPGEAMTVLDKLREEWWWLEPSDRAQGRMNIGLKYIP